MYEPLPQKFLSYFDQMWKIRIKFKRFWLYTGSFKKIHRWELWSIGKQLSYLYFYLFISLASLIWKPAWN